MAVSSESAGAQRHQITDAKGQDKVLRGWGGHVAPGVARRSVDLAKLTEGAVLSRGLARSYGDSALPPQGVTEVADTTLADRILGFDEGTGLLRAEAGLSLLEINRLFVPRGWFSPVTPGTQFVTLGGMVASDVHGKNHHVEGCFGEHVTSMTLRVADGRIVRCGPGEGEEPELFWATVGGMGLTGHILEVSFPMRRIPTPWILQETERVPNIDAFLVALEEAGSDWPFTVGWIDCLSRGASLGRGILYRGRWAEPSEAPASLPKAKKPLTFPFMLPSWILNPLTIKAFNALLYRSHFKKVKRGVVSPDTFFYPLDGIRHWNRMYGHKGFVQHQAVLPREAGPGVARRYLELLTELGGASFLAVIKDCGAEGRGLLSFPKPGISVALDIPVRAGTPAQVDKLNEFVIAQGGRIYLTKDSFTTPEDFRAMEPRLDAFQAVRRAWDPQGKIASAQSVRVFGDACPSPLALTNPATSSEGEGS